MNSPWMQSILNNPEVLRSILQADPTVRAMGEANPEMAAVMNDPDTLRQMSRVMANPVRGFCLNLCYLCMLCSEC